MVVSIRTVVDLPAPFGPEHAEDARLRDLEVDPLDRDVLAVALLEAFGFDHRALAHRGLLCSCLRVLTDRSGLACRTVS